MARMRQAMTFAKEYSDAMRTGEPGACVPPNLCRLCEKPFGNHYVDGELNEAVCTCRSMWKFGLSHEERTITFEALPYHVLAGDAVEALREAGAGGGLAYCERCGKGIFIAGYPDRGMIVRGFPTDIPLKGVSL